MPSRPKRWKRVAVVFSVLSALVVLGLLGLNGIAWYRLWSRLAAIRRADEPTTPAELDSFYPAPPPRQNAAPLFLAAFKLMRGRPEREAALPVVGQGDLPEPGESIPQETLEAIRAYLAEKQEALPLLRQAVALDECRFDVDFSEGIGARTDHLGILRAAARLFALEAVERIEDGKLDQAAESLWAALRCGYAVRREPLLLSGLIRFACDAIAVRYIGRWASAAAPSPEACARLETALAAEADPRMLERIIIGERCLLIQSNGKIVGRLSPLNPFAALWDTDLAFQINCMNDELAAARLPYPESLIHGATFPRRKIPKLYAFSSILLPSLHFVFIEAQEHMARVDSARVALAALRYRVAHGHPPDALADLVPGLIEAIPPDPFDGQPLRYRKAGDGFVVYAVGRNGHDDEGQTEWDRETNQYPDVGFRVRWPKAQP